MKEFLCFASILFLGGSVRGETAPPPRLPEAWRYVQSFDVQGTGLVKISLPLATLNAARPGLEDLRLYDATGKELPYLIDHPAPSSVRLFPVRSFSAKIRLDATVITFETAQSQPVDEVVLDTPAPEFIKAASVAGSQDATAWTVLTADEPLFRQANGAAKLGLRFAAGAWKQMRILVADRASAAIPFTGASVRLAAAQVLPALPYEVKLREREEVGDQTRLILETEGAHVTLAGIELQTTEPFFARPVTLASRQLVENEVREVVLAQGTIYRVGSGQTATSNLVVASETPVPVPELILTIQNGSSPPMQVSGVRGRRRPVYLTWFLSRPGSHYLLSGNPGAAAPHYDLAQLPTAASGTLVEPSSIANLTTNAYFRQPEPVPALAGKGTAIDLSGWSARKRIAVSVPGLEQLELDPEVLAQAAAGLADVRLVQHGQQLPYLIERTALLRQLALTVTRQDDPKKPQTSRWALKLPVLALPIQQIACECDAPFFKRDAALTEQIADERGNLHWVTCGSAAWVRALNQPKAPVLLPVSTPPRSDTLFLEIDNGDNTPLSLTAFSASYSVTRLLFKVTSPDDLYLYYGNRTANPPQYDIDLIALQLYSAEKQPASLSAAEVLRKGWTEAGRSAPMQKILLWVVLAGVVVAMLVIIARLLPKPSGGGGGG